jgi:peroxiredoxin
MAALEPGNRAPDLVLPNMEGSKVSLAEGLRRGPVVAAFFKISCPICQYTFPFLERIHQAYKGKVTFLGISQNPKKDTAGFLKEYGVTFTTLIDDSSRYVASNAYGLTNVPSIFLIGPEGEIEQTIVGWDRKEMEKLNARLAELTREKASPVFRPGEQIEDFKAG